MTGSAPRCARIIALILSALLADAPAGAGILKRFEKEATTPRPAAPTPPTEPKAHEADDVGLAELLLYGIVGSIVYGGASSWARVRGGERAAPLIPAEEAPGGEEMEEERPAPRKPGEALIPFARIDLGRQDVDDDVRAVDLRAEVGYAMAAVQVRWTKYEEDLPRAELTATGVHALYRMSFGRRVEVDLGAGPFFLRGAEGHSGLSFTLPVLVHPSNRYGFEFRPVWSWPGGDPVADYDIAVLVGARRLSLRAGYRWVRSGEAHLDGPELGISARW